MRQPIQKALLQFRLDSIRGQILAFAILAALESLLSATVGDSLMGAGHNDRHNPNVELIALGVANVMSPLVGGIPVTGAIARTATNFRAGARTPVAGVVHALTLLLVVLALSPLAKFIPLATLAAVLFEFPDPGELLAVADRSTAEFPADRGDAGTLRLRSWASVCSVGQRPPLSLCLT